MDQGRESIHWINKLFPLKPTLMDMIGLKTCTGKFFSEALILASTNPLNDKRFFIELQVQYMKIVSSEHAQNMLCT